MVQLYGPSLDFSDVARTKSSSRPVALTGVDGHEDSLLHRHSVSQLLEVEHQDILSDSRTYDPRNARSDVARSQAVDQDSQLDLDAVRQVAKRLSDALKTGRPDFSLASPRVFSRGMSYSHYRDLFFSEGEKLECRSKSRSYMLQLSGGALHRLCRLSENSTPADQDDTSTSNRRREFRRWEARFAIIDAIVGFFRDSKSLEAFRVYEAVIGKLSLTKRAPRMTN